MCIRDRFNPARTWTAEGEIGIGGVFMCIYGMESPGGYQLVGRTASVWNNYKRTKDFRNPWLLEDFDQIEFFPVSEPELDAFRAEFRRGRASLEVREEVFDVGAYLAMLRDEADSIRAFEDAKRVAFEAERERWREADAAAAAAGAGVGGGAEPES